jgi:hypothetical protein
MAEVGRCGETTPAARPGGVDGTTIAARLPLDLG